MARCAECRENRTAGGIGHARDGSTRRGRVRLSPSDAQDLREERRRQAIAQREREAERRRQIVAGTSAALLGRRPLPAPAGRPSMTWPATCITPTTGVNGGRFTYVPMSRQIT